MSGSHPGRIDCLAEVRIFVLNSLVVGSVFILGRAMLKQ
jgi:hypothetical protein